MTNISADILTNCGPKIAGIKPMAIKYDIAFGRNSSDAVSIAANLKNAWADIYIPVKYDANRNREKEFHMPLHSFLKRL